MGKLTWENVDNFKLLIEKIKHKKTGKKYYLHESCDCCGDPFYSTLKYSKFCSRKCSHLNQKINFNYLKNFIENEIGYTLLSNEYQNWREKLTIKCDKEHIFEMSFGDISQGARCPYCCKNPRKNWEDIVNIFDYYGFELISNKEEYETTNGSILKYKCKKCGFINYKTLSKFQSRGTQCPRCNNVEKKVPISYEYVKNSLEEENWVLHTKKEDFVSANKTLIDCTCPKWA